MVTGLPAAHSAMLPVYLVLIFLGRQLFALLKQKLGPHQADAVSLRRIHIPEFGEPGHIDHQSDRLAARRCHRAAE